MRTTKTVNANDDDDDGKDTLGEDNEQKLFIVAVAEIATTAITRRERRLVGWLVGLLENQLVIYQIRDY